MKTVATVGELLGFVLASYGVLRESFADLAQTRDYGEGRYGEGAFGGSGRMVTAMVTLGVFLRLLPGDKHLSLADRRKNAAFAIAGVVIAGAAFIVDSVL